MIADRGWDLHLFPAYPAPPNPHMCAVRIHQPYVPPARGDGERELPLPGFARADMSPARLVPFEVSTNLFAETRGDPAGRVSLGEAGGTAAALHGPKVLRDLIKRLKPDLIHSMEFQLCGYLVSKAKQAYAGSFPAWLATNWGSDIFYFGRQEQHQKQIERLLQQIDFYSCECHRDIALARAFGYRGPVLTVLPNTGGFDLSYIAKLQSGIPPSRRKRIMVKGYEHFAGRALRSLGILESLTHELKDYEIILYSGGHEPISRARELVRRGLLNITVIGWATHDQMLSYFGSSRLYLGVSISDAISTSVLEAMAMGAFPIQTNTSCCDEWFDDGVGGFIVPPDDTDLIRARLLTALRDNRLVDEAAETNARTVDQRLNRRKLAPRVAAFYKPIFDHLRLSGQVDIRSAPSNELTPACISE